MRRNHVAPLVLALLALTLAGPAGAQEIDLSGPWKLTVFGKSPLGSGDAQLVFAGEGHRLTVSLQQDGGKTDCIGYVDEGQLHFYFIQPGKKEDLVARFSGHVRGDLMGGEIDMGKKGVATWAATRGAELETDLTGTWTLQMKGESPSGLDLVKMSFRQEGANLVVTLRGPSQEVECRGSIEGKTIHFYYVRITDEGQFVARFSGQLAGAVMGGEVDMGEHGKTTWRASRDIEI